MVISKTWYQRFSHPLPLTPQPLPINFHCRQPPPTFFCQQPRTQPLSTADNDNEHQFSGWRHQLALATTSWLARHCSIIAWPQCCHGSSCLPLATHLHNFLPPVVTPIYAAAGIPALGTDLSLFSTQRPLYVLFWVALGWLTVLSLSISGCYKVVCVAVVKVECCTSSISIPYF